MSKGKMNGMHSVQSASSRIRGELRKLESVILEDSATGFKNVTGKSFVYRSSEITNTGAILTVAVSVNAQYNDDRNADLKRYVYSGKLTDADGNVLYGYKSAFAAGDEGINANTHRTLAIKQFATYAATVADKNGNLTVISEEVKERSQGQKKTSIEALDIAELEALLAERKAEQAK
jgi:hypothetical protein